MEEEVNESVNNLEVAEQEEVVENTANETETTEYGIQMIPMQVENAGDGLIHSGVAFLKI